MIEMIMKKTTRIKFNSEISKILSFRNPNLSILKYYDFNSNSVCSFHNGTSPKTKRPNNRRVL